MISLTAPLSIAHLWLLFATCCTTFPVGYRRAAGVGSSLVWCGETVSQSQDLVVISRRDLQSAPGPSGNASTGDDHGANNNNNNGRGANARTATLTNLQANTKPSIAAIFNGGEKGAVWHDVEYHFGSRWGDWLGITRTLLKKGWGEHRDEKAQRDNIIVNRNLLRLAQIKNSKLEAASHVDRDQKRHSHGKKMTPEEDN